MNAYLAAARKFAAAGALPECRKSMTSAHGFLWLEYGQKLGVLVPIGARITAALLWKTALDQAKLPAEVESRLVKARPYLFGSVKTHFNHVDFGEAASLIEELVRTAGSAST
jgi:hypothetical protein